MTQNEMEKPEIIEDLGTDTVLCAVTDIEDPGSKGFRVGRRERLFVVRKGGAIFAYMNLCPHQGTTLDWKPDAFLSYDKDMILCSMHSALFNIDDGICVDGPCPGQGLEPVKIALKDGGIFLAA